MKRFLFVLVLVVGAGIDWRVDACSYCDPAFKRRLTLREDARQAKFVILGTANESTIQSDMTAQTVITVDAIIKDDPFLRTQTRLTLPRYIPIDAQKPPKFILFGDLFQGKSDLYRGIPIKDLSVVDYLRQVLRQDDTQRERSLLFYFSKLDSPHPEIAADAFLEFAKARDAEVVAVAKQIQPEILRKLLLDPKTPPERLSLFAFLLGSCGVKEDEAFLKKLLSGPDDRVQSSLGGILGGLIELNAREGWRQVGKVISNPKEPFANRLSALNTVRFYQASKPREHRAAVLDVVRSMVLDGELADMAVEDLRRWGWWDLTPLILEQMNQPSHAAPIVQRAIVRYALTCPDPRCVEFIARRRTIDPTLVTEVQEGLEFDKPQTEKK